MHLHKTLITLVRLLNCLWQDLVVVRYEVEVLKLQYFTLIFMAIMLEGLLATVLARSVCLVADKNTECCTVGLFLELDAYSVIHIPLSIIES